MKDHVAIVIRKGGSVLFCQRAATKKTLPNIWAVPSGTLEEGEIAAGAAVREAKEELGVTVVAGSEFAVVDVAEFGARLHFLFCELFEGEPTIQAADELQALRWMTFQEFFSEFDDARIGHGLRYLRQHTEAWEPHFA